MFFSKCSRGLARALSVALLISVTMTTAADGEKAPKSVVVESMRDHLMQYYVLNIAIGLFFATGLQRRMPAGPGAITLKPADSSSEKFEETKLIIFDNLRKPTDCFLKDDNTEYLFTRCTPVYGESISKDEFSFSYSSVEVQ